MASLIACSNQSCIETVHAEFELEMDPVILGKINVINSSTNVRTYEWTMSISDSMDGEYGYQSSYNHQTDRENPAWYAQENAWFKIQLRALGSVKESYATRKIEVTNIPDTLAFGNFVVTEINYRDQDGFEWDDIDGVANAGDYSNTVAYPDLLVNARASDHTHFPSDVYALDFNFETDLPLTIPIEKEEMEGISPQTMDVFVELIDYDPAIVFGGETGKRMGVATFDPYYMTHVSDGGNDDNYPSQYMIDGDNYKGYIELIWR